MMMMMISRYKNHTTYTNPGRIATKDVWSAVRQLTGRIGSIGGVSVESVESLNTHYASLSTDPSHSAPLAKATVTPLEQEEYISEWQVFQVLDHLHPTATGRIKYEPSF